MTGPNPPLARRAALKISLTLSGLLALAGVLGFLGYRQPPPPAQRFTLLSPLDYAVGSVTFLPSARAWVLRDKGGLYAISSTCTHLGCTLGHTGTAFDCPCHGSKFNLAGLVINGPAIESLPHLELSLSAENKVVLDASVRVPYTQRLPVNA